MGGDAASKAKCPYRNCAELNARYPNGVARACGKDVRRGNTPSVTTFVVDGALYKLGSASLDRDKDGVACEKL